MKDALRSLWHVYPELRTKRERRHLAALKRLVHEGQWPWAQEQARLLMRHFSDLRPIDGALGDQTEFFPIARRRAARSRTAFCLRPNAKRNVKILPKNWGRARNCPFCRTGSSCLPGGRCRRSRWRNIPALGDWGSGIDPKRLATRQTQVRRVDADAAIDVLVVWKLDRLSRSLFIQRQVKRDAVPPRTGAPTQRVKRKSSRMHYLWPFPATRSEERTVEHP
jgi:hypothetical protein